MNDSLVPNDLQEGINRFLSEVEPDQAPVLLLATLTQAAILADELGMDARHIKAMAQELIAEHGPGEE